jgi:hypothetical protein
MSCFHIMYSFLITAQKPIVSPEELDAMISSSLRDIPSDAEVSDVDDAEVEVNKF